MKKLLKKLFGPRRREIVLEMDGFTIEAWQRGDAKGIDITDNRPCRHNDPAKPNLIGDEEPSKIYMGVQFAPPLQDDDHKDDEILAIVSSPGSDDLDAHKPTIEGLIAALRRIERYAADIDREYAAKKSQS